MPIGSKDAALTGRHNVLSKKKRENDLGISFIQYP
jgi:hypothetical protein